MTTEVSDAPDAPLIEVEAADASAEKVSGSQSLVTAPKMGIVTWSDSILAIFASTSVSDLLQSIDFGATLRQLAKIHDAKMSAACREISVLKENLVNMEIKNAKLEKDAMAATQAREGFIHIKEAEAKLSETEKKHKAGLDAIDKHHHEEAEKITAELKTTTAELQKVVSKLNTTNYHASSHQVEFEKLEKVMNEALETKTREHKELETKVGDDDSHRYS